MKFNNNMFFLKDTLVSSLSFESDSNLQSPIRLVLLESSTLINSPSLSRVKDSKPDDIKDPLRKGADAR
ncbi:hypothetical protein TNCV_2004351 [Trichonephila clavipes]|nr:hypothetical protein TNCV_2004351 [Trichonephila clavipes]